MNNEIKIIGGKFKGKKIHFPNNNELRPTPNRIRETLFNWLMHVIDGSNCLDAFAGSGALGIEACSRGAKNVVLIEKSLITYKNLKNVCATLKTNAIKIINTDAKTYFSQVLQPFDIIFLDPPFQVNNYHELIYLITRHNLLKSHGLLYLESAKLLTLDSLLWEPVKTKQLPNISYALYRKL